MIKGGNNTSDVVKTFREAKKRNSSLVLAIITENQYFIFDKDVLTEMISKTKEILSLEETVEMARKMVMEEEKDLIIMIDKVDGALDRFITNQWKEDIKILKNKNKEEIEDHFFKD